MTITEAELVEMETRLLATQDKTLGPMENVAAITGIADECVPRLVAEVRRLRSFMLSAAKDIDIAEGYCTDMGQSIALGHAMESLGLALRWPVLECGIDRSALSNHCTECHQPKCVCDFRMDNR